MDDYLEILIRSLLQFPAFCESIAKLVERFSKGRKKPPKPPLQLF